MPQTINLNALFMDNAHLFKPCKDTLLDELPISGISASSQCIKTGFLFVAKRGATKQSRDGHDFIDDAILRGAKAVVVDSHWQQRELSVPILVADDTALALSYLCESFFGWPSRKLKLIGITGTNGKSSTSFMLYSILKAAGFRTALMGTLGIGEPSALLKSSHTTLDPEHLSATLSSMVGDGYTHVVMEVSSHALAQQRVCALDFAAVGFSNLSQDHLDFHGSMDNYKHSKELLFTSLAKAHTHKVLPIDHPFDLKDAPRKILFDTHEELGLTLPFLGEFHKKNALLAKYLALSLGISEKPIVAGLKECPPIPGRLEIISENPRVVVDFAHTPDALRSVLENLRADTLGKLIVVFGCGGDRDQEKRPIMGQIASTLADRIIVTDDNPRFEDPALIRAAIMAGMKGSLEIHEIADRKKAIKNAIINAQRSDTVLIAGKGHEDYQIYKDQAKRFSDQEEARLVLGELCKL
jgi:UDP-N-acetylmuramoyl-L-alanyl-D-glutamate--2,6-diaminopimelate ligase